MPLKELTEQEKNIGYAIGFVKAWSETPWLVGARTPTPIKDSLKIITDGVWYYRDKYVEMQELNVDLQTKYNELTALSAGYLSELQTIRQQLDEVLTEDQKQFHKKETDADTVESN